VTLRGVARGAGITPSAIYRYYSSLDSLVEALRADLCAELRLFLESARDEAPSSDPADRVSLISLSLRGWALDRRGEFALIFSPPTDFQPDPAGGRKCDPDASIGVLIIDEFVGMWTAGRLGAPAEAAQAGQLDGYLSPIIARRYPKLPASIIDAALIAWVKLRGVLMTEAFGQLTPVAADGQGLFQLELAALIDWFTAERRPE
jgi:AcrR family transcriptional regulator